jgi:hypothetical protein
MQCEVQSSAAYIDHELLLQLQALNAQLQVENRIKEGAENLLQMPMEVRL